MLSARTKGAACMVASAFGFALMAFCVRLCDDFGEPVWVDFEYIKVPIPQNAHRILQLQFGPDYMTPLQLSAAHSQLRYDTGKSYLEIKQ